MHLLHCTEVFVWSVCLHLHIAHIVANNLTLYGQVLPKGHALICIVPDHLFAVLVHLLPCSEVFVWLVYLLLHIEHIMANNLTPVHFCLSQ